MFIQHVIEGRLHHVGYGVLLWPLIRDKRRAITQFKNEWRTCDAVTLLSGATFIATATGILWVFGAS